MGRLYERFAVEMNQRFGTAYDATECRDKRKMLLVQYRALQQLEALAADGESVPEADSE